MRELYLFQDGVTYYSYTSGITSYSFESREYKPITITRGEVRKTSNNLKATLTVSFKNTEPFAKNLLFLITESDIKFTLYRDGLIYYQGYVISAKYTGRVIEIGCSTAPNSLRSARLQEVRSLTCRHVLYGVNCKVNPVSHRATFTGITVNSTIVTIPSLTAPSNYYSNGLIEIGTVTRGIKKQVGSVLYLAAPFPFTHTGSINIYPGCDLSEATCLSKYNNVINFGGFSRIPFKDPYGGGGVT